MNERTPRDQGGRGGGRPGRKGAGRGGPGFGRPRGAGRFERRGERFERPGPVRDRARDRAASALARQARRWPDFELLGVDLRGLDGRDGAFAKAIYERAIARWLTLRWMIETNIRGDWDKLDPKAIGVLVSGAAQLVLMDRVPVRAAVFESVEWAKSRISRGSAGLVNAVLRGVDRMVQRDEEGRAVREAGVAIRGDALPMGDGTSLLLADELLPDDPLRRVSIGTSHPIEMLRSWVKHFGRAEATRMALHGLSEPPIILNIAHAEVGIPECCEPHSLPGHAVWAGTGAELEASLSGRRDIWVQDPSASLGVMSVSDLRATKVVDLCAGLGTKTRQLAATFGEAQIVATDIDAPRLAVLRETFEGHPRVRVVEYQDVWEAGLGADLVLLDVPCSNTGVLARRVEARYRWSPAREEGLIGMQRQLIADSLRLIDGSGGEDGKRGGLVYSTCSVSPAENEDVVRWAAKWHGLEIEREMRREPRGGPGEGPERYSDGGYAALLR